MTTHTDAALTTSPAWQETDARFGAYAGPEDFEAYREIGPPPENGSTCNVG